MPIPLRGIYFPPGLAGLAVPNPGARQVREHKPPPSRWVLVPVGLAQMLLGVWPELRIPSEMIRSCVEKNGVTYMAEADGVDMRRGPSPDDLCLKIAIPKYLVQLNFDIVGNVPVQMNVEAPCSLELRMHLPDSSREVVDVMIDSTSPSILEGKPLRLFIPDIFVYSLRVKGRVNVDQINGFVWNRI